MQNEANPKSHPVPLHKHHILPMLYPFGSPQMLLLECQGERFLLQAGECMQLHELPAGTRVVYAGLVKDGENDADKVGAVEVDY